MKRSLPVIPKFDAIWEKFCFFASKLGGRDGEMALVTTHLKLLYWKIEAVHKCKHVRSRKMYR